MLKVLSVLWAFCAFSLPASAQRVDWRECYDGTPSQEEVAEMQLLVRNVGCLKLDGRFVQETEGVDKLWGHGSSGRLNSCSGRPDLTSGFNGFLNRSRQVDKYRPGMSVAQIKRTLFAGWDDSRGDDLNADCRPRSSAGRPVGGKKCDFPKSANDWLDTLGKIARPATNEPNASKELKLVSGLRDLEAAAATVLTDVKEPNWTAIEWMGDNEKIKKTRDALEADIKKVVETKRKLSKYMAIINNDDPTCMKCILLADFDLLMSVASPSARDGKRYIRGRHRPQPPDIPKTISIDMSTLRFEVIRDAHKLIRKWAQTRIDFEVKKQALVSDTQNLGEIARSFAAAGKDEALAKQAVIEFLDEYDSPHAVTARLATPPVGRMPSLGIAFNFASQRNNYCGDIAIEN